MHIISSASNPRAMVRGALTILNRVFVISLAALFSWVASRAARAFVLSPTNGGEMRHRLQDI